MAKEKVTISLDRAKAERARVLLATHSTSETIDVALDRVIRRERLRADIAAYQRIPPTPAEDAIAALADTSGMADDTDWESLYPDLKDNE